MLKSKKGLLLISAAVIFAQSTNAIAADLGTDANTPVNNTATITYTVGSQNQTTNSNQDSFVVDRKVNLTVTEDPSVLTTNVTYGAVNQVTTFTVRNLTNDTLDFILSSSEMADGAATPRGTDGLTLTSTAIWIESNGTPGWQADDTQASYINNLAEDASATVYIVATIPTTGTDGAYAGVVLTAQAAGVSGTVASPAAALTNDSGTANVAGTVQNVFADTTTNNGDAANNGMARDDDDYRLALPVLSVNKASRVTADGVSTSNFKAIPGATVEYCIAVTNGGTAAASSVNVTDLIPANTTYVAGSARTGATVTGSGASAVCSGGTATGTSTTGSPVTQVAGTITSISPVSTAPNNVVGFYFSVTIN